jgi:PPM family protein phosphatase
MTNRASVRVVPPDPADGVRAAGASDPGRVRDQNEDCFHVDAERGIFLVIDGVGGHAAGEVAAAIASQIIVERLQQDMWSPAQRVREAIALANNEILRRATATPAYAGMTCVVTVALVQPGRLTVGHVGDSRLYALSPQGIRKLTHDHSPIGEREDAGEISEADAMRHPRRNEVFRDVGSAHHEPDDADFVELIETTFEPHEALVLCSDGLSDMLTAAAIESTVRQHAGDPPAVAQALVDAANAAGGKDNVTAVYVEGSRFAATPAASVGAAIPLAAGADQGASARAARAAARPSLLWRIFASRVLWFTIGAIAGVALALGLQRYLGEDAAPPVAETRRLVVGSDGADASVTDAGSSGVSGSGSGVNAARFATIAGALAAANPRDVVEVEPGEYAESLTLPPGVQLVARVPGSVILIAPEGQPGWTSLAADGSLGNRISGLRILGRPNAPIATGLRLGGHQLDVDDVTIEGQVETGMDVHDDGAILVRASRFVNVTGTGIRIGAGARPAIRQNVFTRAAQGGGPAVDIGEGTTPALLDNVFAGYQEREIVRTAPIAPAAATARARALLQGNYVIRGRTNGR